MFCLNSCEKHYENGRCNVCGHIFYHWWPEPGFPWLLVSADGKQFYFRERLHAEIHAKTLIEDCCGHIWNQKVQKIVICKVELVATQTNVKHRPPEEELDENECDSTGEHWGFLSHICSYEMKPPSAQEE